SAHAITLSAGSASYENQSAAAAPDVVRCPISPAKIAVRYPRSAKTTAHVNPDTPAPTIATLLAMKMIYVQSVATSYKMARDGYSKSRCVDGKGSRRRANFNQ